MFVHHFIHVTGVCVYLRCRAGCQKSRYAVYSCFYVFPGSQCAVYACFYMFLAPQRLPGAPQRPNRSSTEAQKELPNSPQTPPEAQRRATDTQQRPEEAHSGPHNPSKAARVRNLSAFSHVFSRFRVNLILRIFEALGGCQGSVYTRFYVFLLTPMCNLY